MELADDFTPPLPKAMHTRPNSRPDRPGMTASRMWPSITTMPEINSVFSAPKIRSASHAPRMVER